MGRVNANRVIQKNCCPAKDGNKNKQWYQWAGTVRVKRYPLPPPISFGLPVTGDDYGNILELSTENPQHYAIYLVETNQGKTLKTS